MKVGLFWFSQDLRLHDQPLLHQAAQQVDSLICLHCLPSLSAYLSHFAQVAGVGQAKRRFLAQSVRDLDSALHQHGHRLITTDLHPYFALYRLISRHHVTHLYSAAFPGTDEQQVVNQIGQIFPHLQVCQHEHTTLFEQQQLPFALDQLPVTFSQFRRRVEDIEITQPVAEVTSLPAPVEVETGSGGCGDSRWAGNHGSQDSNSASGFTGGEKAGLRHARAYFSSPRPADYKQTRNALDGWELSTKFSPWLAHGCLSPRTLLAMLKDYERVNGSNESTYWIFFELLWREYFYWYARRYRKRLFCFSGINGKAPLASFYPQRFALWKNGQTPWPLVNACMHQLRATGYMSNRGRQLVASCLIHELGLDWRFGAAYFETQLIDYDVASNWGNWQYLAGVGADPRGSRQFDLDKQTHTYDPNHHFIDKWQGECPTASLDSVDMVDWPIMHTPQTGDTP
jgi:deoxyribodipyrimidine photo-lyase